MAFRKELDSAAVKEAIAAERAAWERRNREQDEKRRVADKKHQKREDAKVKTMMATPPGGEPEKGDDTGDRLIDIDAKLMLIDERTREFKGLLETIDRKVQALLDNKASDEDTSISEF
jgi:transcription initiation factor TFIIIB Brf1 subunit/transcription initiation factor TFIIB